MRWRRKIEKDEQYVTQMMKISGAMEGCIKQNNGIDIYVEYFEEPDDGTQCEAPQVKTIGLHTKL